MQKCDGCHQEYPIWKLDCVTWFNGRTTWGCRGPGTQNCIKKMRDLDKRLRAQAGKPLNPAMRMTYAT